MIKENVFLLHSNCMPVKGYRRSIICDLQRHEIELIPNDLYEILSEFQGKTINHIKKFYKNKYDFIIDDYFSYLVRKEYVFFTNTPRFFPKMNLEYNSPFEITNAIIDVTYSLNFLALNENIIDQLIKLKCKHFEIRIFDKFSIEDIISLLKMISVKDDFFFQLGLYVKYSNEMDSKFLKNILKEYSFINYIILYNSKVNEFKKFQDLDDRYVVQIKENFLNEKSCGKIDKTLFISNVKTYTESQSNNSCLNRKVSVDKEGNIKNCPSMLQHFGNIKDCTIEEALNHKDFKKYWNITKDQIDVCKDCEFRYVCTDCRAYIEEPDNPYSKPLKCGYNPYTNIWEEWSTNPLKQRAIEHYNFLE
ncbi:grasp-with-spasm system SPASM domain peptide maturase [Flavobacterium jejuense]|uniref:Grasp-with-spasm system SPASM domain peptide maturase n=1 Tax=Flavobacterium jejuense TaxID=1544455 RepID=A0ABX0ISY7_9FLAO|nr:grasp-with-spasm system SPASM domain peptide maturase [Flavobacterium jejuense]NHN26341.1 grasp-with-spasm system SPASM domain peptide maturase [Flavobacterium jejuense]